MCLGSLAPFINVALAAAAIFFLSKLLTGKRRVYPPGPKPLPVIGNILDLPREDDKVWSYWKKFTDLYGPISSLRVFNKVLVIIGDADIAFDLLVKRSKIFSDRPPLAFSGEMIGWNNAPSHMSYSGRLLEHRRQYHQIIGTKDSISRFHHIQELEMHHFLLRVLDDSLSLNESIRLLLGAVLLNVAYGYNVEHEIADPLIAFLEQIAGEASDSFEPGRWMVDVLPFLRYIPDWIPGAEFKRIAARWRRNLSSAIEIPYLFAKRNTNSGNACPSLVSILLENSDYKEEDIIKWTAGTLYAAGIDTTSATLQKFFLAMALYPEVQANAQREIDGVTNGKRLPSFDDRERLPYINALVKEITRWNTVAPVGFPHAASEDTEYNGYFIPKGASIITYTWGMLHDPKIYSDPETFNPGRFLDTNGNIPEKDPFSLAFGFGRRVCPGQEFSITLVYLCVAMCLSVFNIEKPPNKDLKVDFTSSLVIKPLNFEVVVSPRSEEARDLIRLSKDEHPIVKGSAGAIKDLLDKMKPKK